MPGSKNRKGFFTAVTGVAVCVIFCGRTAEAWNAYIGRIGSAPLVPQTEAPAPAPAPVQYDGIALEELFPDPVFRSYMQSADLDGNGYLTDEERNAVTTVNVDNYGSIVSLRGIEWLPNLERLTCDGNMISQLDVSSNYNLKVLTFNDNEVSDIDLSYNPNLQELYCKDNYLEYLDLSNNTELTALSVSGNYFDDDAIDFSDFPHLKLYNDISVSKYK